MDFNDYSKIWNPWVIDSSSIWTSHVYPSSRITWDSASILSGRYDIGDIVEEEPEVKVYSDQSQERLEKEYCVVCEKESDLTQDRILLNLSKIKSVLMLKCAPIRLEKIECIMTPTVKNNIVSAWRKINMYGKKTPFLARFDEYGRRLPDEIKIETLRGMTIKIVNPKEYGEHYLEFKGIVSDPSSYTATPEYTYKKDESVFDEDDLPF